MGIQTYSCRRGRRKNSFRKSSRCTRCINNIHRKSTGSVYDKNNNVIPRGPSGAACGASCSNSYFMFLHIYFWTRYDLPQILKTNICARNYNFYQKFGGDAKSFAFFFNISSFNHILLKYIYPLNSHTTTIF